MEEKIMAGPSRSRTRAGRPFARGGGIRAFAASMALVLAAGLTLVPSVAFAAPDPNQTGGGDPQGGLWYANEQAFAKAHADGYRGQGIKVAVIDSRLNPDVPELAGQNITIREPSYCLAESGEFHSATTTLPSAAHGTSMASLIVGTGANGGIVGAAPDAELLYYAPSVYDIDNGAPSNWTEFSVCGHYGTNAEDAFGEALAQAVADGADIISVSITTGFSDIGKKAVLDALRAGVIIVHAFPNETRRASMGFLDSANGLLSMAAYDAAGQSRPDVESGEATTHKLIDLVAPGVDIQTFNPDDRVTWDKKTLVSGNSDATAITAGMLAVVMSKYPEATGNQILQSALRNTDRGKGNLNKDKNRQWGYGKFNLTQTLAQDPTKYPDENPLLSKSGAARPSYEEVTGHSGVEETKKPPSAEAANDGPSTVLWVSIGIALVVAIAGSVVAIAVTRSRRKRAQQLANAHPSYQSIPYQGGPYTGQVQPAPGGQWQQSMPGAAPQPFANQFDSQSQPPASSQQPPSGMERP